MAKAKVKKVKADEWQNRIIESGEMPANQYLAHEMNARRHPGIQREALRGSLNAVGWIAPVIVSARTGKMLDGHARIEEALTKDENALVPFVKVDVSEAEELLILGTFDPITNQATYDKGALDNLLQGISTGEDGLQALLADLAAKQGLYYGDNEPVPGAGGDDFDTTPEEDQTRVQYGDLWACGEHRVLCGDSTKAEDVARVMGGENAALCFTSPPYAAQREYTIEDFDWDVLMDGVFLSVFDLLAPDASVLINLGIVHKDGKVNRYWDGWIGRMELAGNPLYGWYVWDQGWGLPGDWAGRLAPSFEFIFHFARSPRHTEKTEKTVSEGKIRNSTFRQSDGTLKPFTGNGQATGGTKVADSVVRVNRQIGSVTGGDHPAVFSVDFPVHCMPIWTDAGDSIFDPFGGSGTTLIACERTNRKCRMIEIAPKYVNVILSRYEAETGKEAQLLERLNG